MSVRISFPPSHIRSFVVCSFLGLGVQANTSSTLDMLVLIFIDKSIPIPSYESDSLFLGSFMEKTKAKFPARS